MENTTTFLIITICALLVSAAVSTGFTIAFFGVILESGVVEEKLVSGLQEELSQLEINCNPEPKENATVIKLEELTLYCVISKKEVA